MKIISIAEHCSLHLTVGDLGAPATNIRFDYINHTVEISGDITDVGRQQFNFRHQTVKMAKTWHCDRLKMKRVAAEVDRPMSVDSKDLI